MKKVAFICYANACRSQIAEAISKVLGNGLYKPYSAGLHPLGTICKEVKDLLLEKGIEISDQYSKGIEDIPIEEMDFVITMGCCSANDICPVFFSGKKLDWNIPDPYGMNKETIKDVFDIIEGKIRKFISENFQTST